MILDSKKPNTRTRVKICGITNLADARFAAEAGADYLGFIFYPSSKRAISAVKVKNIVEQLRKSSNCPILVGVFVNETIRQIADILEKCDLDLAQLSGTETPNYLNDPTSVLYGRCYKTIRPQSIEEAVAETDRFMPPEPSLKQPTILVDTYHPNLYGGTGLQSDWSLAATIASVNPRMMLAGGLRPENVTEAINKVRPFAVDVASGVELKPGKKDPEKVRTFIDVSKGNAN
jgi:phosphoribosylanthranilate isomerase